MMAFLKPCWCRVLLLGCIGFTIPAMAYNPLGQNVQISTQFNAVQGKPSWLLILRDVESGRVSPYLFDVRRRTNYWISFSYGHAYRVTASIMQFSPTQVINDFCHLEDGILIDKSMIVRVTGTLTANPRTSHCYVSKFTDLDFTIVQPEESGTP